MDLIQRLAELGNKIYRVDTIHARRGGVSVMPNGELEVFDEPLRLGGETRVRKSRLKDEVSDAAIAIEEGTLKNVRSVALYSRREVTYFFNLKIGDYYLIRKITTYKDGSLEIYELDD